MVTLLLDSTQFEVALSGPERALAFRREPVRVAREHIRKVQLTEDAWTWIRGTRSAGTAVRGLLAMGTWRSAGGRDFVVVRRHGPAAVIDLDGHPEFERLVLSTSHGLQLVQALRLETDDTPTDVVDIVTGAITLPREDPEPGAS